MSICILCKKEFTPKHNTFGLYCSLLCCNKAKHKVIELNCELCGVSFSCRPSEIKKFCSRKCSAKNSAQNRSKRLRIEKVCLGCTIKFTTVPCENNDFCSQPCWLKYQTVHKLNMNEEARNRPAVDTMQEAFAKQREDLVNSLTFISNVVSGIYVIINVKNKMIYVGSSHDIEGRWKDHLNKLYGNRHENEKFQNAWNKYGEKAFEFKILEAVEPLKELLEQREQHYINLYKSYERNIGYNLFKIAYSPLGSKRTPEQREAMSIARQGKPSPMEGRKHSPESKETMKQVHLARYAKLQEEGKLPPQTGYGHTDKARRKISEGHKGIKFPKEFGEAIRQRRLGSKKVNGHMVYPGDPNYPA